MVLSMDNVIPIDSRYCQNPMKRPQRVKAKGVIEMQC